MAQPLFSSRLMLCERELIVSFPANLCREKISGWAGPGATRAAHQSGAGSAIVSHTELPQRRIHTLLTICGKIKDRVTFPHLLEESD